MVVEIQNVLINFKNVEEVYVDGTCLIIKFVSGNSRSFCFEYAERAETQYKFIKSKINNKKV